MTLYKAGDSNGGTAVSLGTGTTNAQGKFSISFTKPDEVSFLYMIASGGDSGKGFNSGITLLLMLGQTGNLPSNPVTINEVTSVVVGYGMDSFIQRFNEYAISGDPSALENAITATLALADPTTGEVKSSSNTDLKNLINGLADILASCVDGSASDCNTLFGESAPPGGAVPTDTFAALLDMLENPTNNVFLLWGLIGSSPPYPTSSTPPPSFSINPSPSIVVSPNFFIIPVGARLQMSVQVFGMSNTSYHWELSPSLGTIDSNDLYTAPAGPVGAIITVRAVSDVNPTIFGTSVISLQAGFHATTLNVASNSGGLKQVILGSASFQSSFSVGMTNTAGLPDLVTANCEAQSISIFWTDNQGSFNDATGQKTVSVGACPVGLTAGIFVNGTPQ
ncbi:MAG TPA: hypothetical protein VNI35_07665, partial [Nitrospira sp.]|nr:hypothetical protein [Nitrospira sp.]